MVKATVKQDEVRQATVEEAFERTRPVMLNFKFYLEKRGVIHDKLEEYLTIRILKILIKNLSFDNYEKEMDKLWKIRLNQIDAYYRN